MEELLNALEMLEKAEKCNSIDNITKRIGEARAELEKGIKKTNKILHPVNPYGTRIYRHKELVPAKEISRHGIQAKLRAREAVVANIFENLRKEIELPNTRPGIVDQLQSYQFSLSIEVYNANVQPGEAVEGLLHYRRSC